MASVQVDPRIERTTARVMRTAHRLLVEEGLDAVTFGRISREAGVSRTTLYRHWHRPTELVADAWARAAPALTIHETLDLRADLVRLFSGLRDFVESPAMRRALPSVIDAAHRHDDIRALHGAFVRERRSPIVDRLRRAVAEHDLTPATDPDVLADLLAGAIFYRRLLRHERTTDAEVEALVDATIAGARP